MSKLQSQSFEWIFKVDFQCCLLLKVFLNKAPENRLPSQSSRPQIFSSISPITNSSWIHSYICHCKIRSMCWETFLSWDMSLSGLYAQTTFSSTFVNTLEDRDSVSLWGKGQRGLLHIRKDPGSLTSGLLSSNAAYWNCNCCRIHQISILPGWENINTLASMKMWQVG